jgi:hypothetical protein
VIAASRDAGGRSSAPPAQAAPISNARRRSRSERVQTWTSQPQWRATWIASRAEAPKP